MALDLPGIKKIVGSRKVENTVNISSGQEDVLQILNLSENLINSAAIDSFTNNQESQTGWLFNMWDGLTSTSFELKDQNENTTNISTLVFDFGVKRQIKTLLFEFNLNSGSTGTAELKVEHSTDNSNWTELFTEASIDSVGNGNYENFDKNKALRYLRLSIKTITTAITTSEIKIYQIILAG